ncbi:MAG: hypothetical protein JWO60_1446, partial [Frankiales bacterium]|nr:hypothetical protein [Frankiales bacterium]
MSTDPPAGSGWYVPPSQGALQPAPAAPAAPPAAPPAPLVPT